jgi:hypothetical protein
MIVVCSCKQMIRVAPDCESSLFEITSNFVFFTSWTMFSLWHDE